MEPLWDINQVCEYLVISTKTFTRITINDPTFPARKIRGLWRCDKDQLKLWVEAQRSTPDRRNVIEITKPRRGRPPLSGTSPKAKVKAR